MAVSRTLRDAPNVSPANREKIKAVALELGYTPDPHVTSLMEHLRLHKQIEGSEVIAHIFCSLNGEAPESSHTQRRLRDGMQQRALELGYGFEDFITHPKILSMTSLARVLRNRGIRGVVVSNTIHLREDLGPILRDFSSCVTGTLHPHLPTCRTSANHYYNMRLAILNLEALGFSRIGLYLNTHTNETQHHSWRAALADFLHPRYADFASLLNIVEDWEKKPFLAWVRRTKPQVILSLHPGIGEWLRESGLDCKTGYALLDLKTEMHGVAGIDQQTEKIGAISVDLVSSRMMKNQTGPTEYSSFTCVNGNWINAPTLGEAPKSLAMKRQKLKAQ